MAFAAWYPAQECTGGARQGARALMKYTLDKFPGAFNLGIYNCRNVRGGSYFSPHAEGRAIDVGFPQAKDGTGSKKGHDFVNALLAADPRKLGVQAIIYDRTIWSAKSPNGRPYTGASPHYDHAHVEVTRSAGNTMTLATVRSVLGTALEASPYEDYRKGVQAGSRTIGKFKTRKWSAGDDVKELQRVLNAWYPGKERLAEDGRYGPKTKARVTYMQRRAGIAVDGITGPQTWSTLRVI